MPFLQPQRATTLPLLECTLIIFLSQMLPLQCRVQVKQALSVFPDKELATSKGSDIKKAFENKVIVLVSEAKSRRKKSLEQFKGTLVLNHTLGVMLLALKDIKDTKCSSPKYNGATEVCI